MNVEGAAPATLLFTDIEGSTRLWEQSPERMRPALARHDVLARDAVEGHRGTVVKMTGDGIYAAFADASDAVAASLGLQLALVDPAATDGMPLRVRCGLHSGDVERRDGDCFGAAVNRAARIMGAAHGGQVLMSQAVIDQVRGRLPRAASLLDLGVVRLRDLARPERVYQLVHPALRQAFPALRSLAATPNNLPQQPSSFIGRERVLAEVTGLLRRGRLLTLVGVGGLGKTRLSLQAAADVLDDFPDGVWLVELAPLSDARLVPQAVASVLGVKEAPGGSIEAALIEHVRERELLLIFDNCEHLTQACADLASALLRAGPQLRVLASSREPLHVAGETTYPLATLAVPDPRRDLPVAALTQYEAVRLFGERAGAAQPSFRITSRNAAIVAEICHRLDGIPLALELAAARVRGLSVQAIVARLTDRFRLLTQGDATALPRQQTLRACIDWSHDLLAEPERALFRRLSVFAGGWTLEAAEAVGAGGDIGAPDVLDLVTRLVEKSLVERDANGGRYTMLETVRQYAQERLDASGEADRVRARHLDCFVALAEKADPLLQGPDQAEWLARLDSERENLRAAHSWCGRSSQTAELGLRLADALLTYWVNRGISDSGYRLTVEALARPGAQARTLLRTRGLLGAGNLAFALGRYAEAQGHLDQGLSIAEELGSIGRISFAHQLLGGVFLGQGDRAGARAHFETALALARGFASKYRLGSALNGLAEFRRAGGDFDAAEPLYEEALALARELGDRQDITLNLLNLAMVSIGRGSAERTAERVHEALAIAEEVGSKYLGQFVLDVAAGRAAFLGEWERAARLGGAAEAVLEAMEGKREAADAMFLAPLMARTREALGEVAFAAAGAAGRARPYEDAIAEVRAWLAEAGLRPAGPADAVA